MVIKYNGATRADKKHGYVSLYGGDTRSDSNWRFEKGNKALWSGFSTIKFPLIFGRLVNPYFWRGCMLAGVRLTGHDNLSLKVQQKPKKLCRSHLWETYTTVDGRNPAPPGMVKTVLTMR